MVAKGTRRRNRKIKQEIFLLESLNSWEKRLSINKLNSIQKVNVDTRYIAIANHLYKKNILEARFLQGED
jgi:hypothetical protein